MHIGHVSNITRPCDLRQLLITISRLPACFFSFRFPSHNSPDYGTHLDKRLFLFPDCNVSLECVDCDRDVVTQVSEMTGTLQLSRPGSHGNLRLTDKVPMNVRKK